MGVEGWWLKSPLSRLASGVPAADYLARERWLCAADRA